MCNSPDLSPVQAALNEAEAELQRLGGDLQFLVGSDGVVEVAGRRRGGHPFEPVRRLALLEGCDPLMWRVAHPEGDVTLGAPFGSTGPPSAGRAPSPRCTVGGEPIVHGAPLELYLRGKPVCARHVRHVAPLPALVHGLLAAGGHLISALGRMAARLEGIENAELREILAGKLVGELADRLLAEAGGWIVAIGGGDSGESPVEDPPAVG